MKKIVADRYVHVVMALLVGVGVFLFWWKAYPHALSYQEQYQLFLFDGDYFFSRLAVAGGMADYIGEFLTQFYYYPWLGAVVIALLFVGLYLLISSTSRHCIIACIPLALLLWHMGDENVLLSYVVALSAALLVAQLMRRVPQWADVVMVPLFYWLFGPMVLLYGALRVVRKGWRGLWILAWAVCVEFIAYFTMLGQWPIETVLLTMCYYRTPMQNPVLQMVIPVVIVLVLLIPAIRQKTVRRLFAVAQLLVLAVLCYGAVTIGFDLDKYELIRQDYLIRNERWGEVIEHAQRYQVRTPFSSVSVNLSLAMTRQLADRMFSFYQSGTDALIMPRLRDMTSDLPSAEAFWRLGMVNSAQRYMFDIQESILNGKKSGRCTQRIAECMIVNGHYTPARKHLALLKKTLFYCSWALKAEQIMSKEAWVNTHPVWGKLRKLRYRSDMLYSYPELEKMLGLLFVNNPENKMALDYMMGQLLLNGNVHDFMQYMSWVQQYGGYSSMPVGYRDAVNCIQQQGRVTGSPYANYVRQMQIHRDE